MKIDVIREMTPEELDSELMKQKNELFNLRFQHVTGQLETLRFLFHSQCGILSLLHRNPPFLHRYLLYLPDVPAGPGLLPGLH